MRITTTGHVMHRMSLRQHFFFGFVPATLAAAVFFDTKVRVT